jgi:hypothetical protein
MSHSISFGPLSIALTGVRIPAAYACGLRAGDTDLYTVPANKKALVIDVSFTNPSSNTENVACDSQVKTGGKYYRFDYVALTAMPGTYGSTSALAPFLLSPGETFAVWCSSAGLSVWPLIVEFDADVPVWDSRLLTLSKGDNTVFSVPEDKTIAFMGMPSTGSGGPLRGKVWYYNSGSESRDVRVHAVPHGRTPSQENAIFDGRVAQRTMVQALLYGGLAAGDGISVSTDTDGAGQIAWVVYAEINN